MRAQANTKLSLPWDNSSDSFYTQDSDNEALSTTTNPNSSNHHHNPQPMVLQNPYQTPKPLQTRPNLLNTLRSWILPQCAPALAPALAPAPAPLIQNIPNIIKIVVNTTQDPIPPTTLHYQPPLTINTTNSHWGDPMQTPKPIQTLQILSRNVDTLSTKQSYLQWKAASQALANCKADAIALQETNVLWNKIHQQKVWQIFHQPTGHVIIATSSSTEISTQPHQ